MEKLRAIAADRLSTEWLQHWWCAKFNRPRKDPLLQEYTLEELMIEWLEYQIEEDPSMAFPRVESADDVVYHTGDPVIDKWEAQIAKGEEIDFETDLGPEGAQTLEKLLRYSRRLSGLPDPPIEAVDEATELEEEEPAEFSDDYTKE